MTTIYAYTRRKAKRDIEWGLSHLKKAIILLVSIILIGYFALGLEFNFSHTRAKEKFRSLETGVKLINILKGVF